MNVLGHAMNSILRLYKISLFIRNLLGREIFVDIMHVLENNYVKHIKECTQQAQLCTMYMLYLIRPPSTLMGKFTYLLIGTILKN